MKAATATGEEILGMPGRMLRHKNVDAYNISHSRWEILGGNTFTSNKGRAGGHLLQIPGRERGKLILGEIIRAETLQSCMLLHRWRILKIGIGDITHEK